MYLKLHDLRTKEVNWRTIDLQETLACLAVADSGGRLLSAKDLYRLNRSLKRRKEGGEEGDGERERNDIAG